MSSKSRGQNPTLLPFCHAFWLVVELHFVLSAELHMPPPPNLELEGVQKVAGKKLTCKTDKPKPASSQSFGLCVTYMWCGEPIKGMPCPSCPAVMGGLPVSFYVHVTVQQLAYSLRMRATPSFINTITPFWTPRALRQMLNGRLSCV